MKNKIKRITAAMLALCCVPVTALRAHALGWWGDTTWEAFGGMEPIQNGTWCENALVFLSETDRPYPQVTVARPRENILRIVLRDAADVGAMEDVLESYFPDFKASLNTERFENEQLRYYNSDHLFGNWSLYEVALDNGLTDAESGRVFELYMQQPTDELQTNLLRDLAKAHLLSGFYGWGATASYQAGVVDKPPLTGYEAFYYIWGTDENGQETLLSQPIDWDAAQTYLDEHHPGCKVESYDSEPYVVAVHEDGSVDTATDTLYRIVPSGELTYQERFELACELCPVIHLGPSVLFMEEDREGAPAIGQNALRNAGDVTLDLELDIMDVIAANRYLLGAETLCDTAKQNADINGSGSPDETDSLAILKEIVGITSDFTE